MRIDETQPNTHHVFKPGGQQLRNNLVDTPNHTNRSIIFKANGIHFFSYQNNKGNITAFWELSWEPELLNDFLHLGFYEFPRSFYKAKIESVRARRFWRVTWGYSVVDFCVCEGGYEHLTLLGR